jgi:GxxExxY protein
MSGHASDQLLEQELTSSVIGAFYEVFNELGFGYREYLYSLAPERALVAIDRRVARELGVMVYFRGEPLAGLTLDMVVDDRVIVEIKSTERLHPESTRQLFGYLCSTNLEVGLLLHFGRDPKFYRVICENRLKRRNAPINRID